MTKIDRIDIIVFESLIIRDKESVVGFHSHQVVVERYAQLVVIFNGPTHDLHIRINCRRSHNALILVWSYQRIHLIDDTIVGHFDVIFAISLLLYHIQLQSHKLFGIIRYFFKLAGDGIGKLLTHQVIDKVGHDDWLLLVQRIQVFYEIGFGSISTRMFTIKVYQIGTIATYKEIDQSLISRSQNSAHIA